MRIRYHSDRLGKFLNNKVVIKVTGWLMAKSARYLLKIFIHHPYVIEHLICYFVGDYLNVLTYGVSVGD